MGRYILKRLLWMIPIILFVAILVFTLMSFAPGKPEELILGSHATAEAYAAKRAELHLDDPYLIRLARFLKQTFIDFDLGTSWFTNEPVSQSIAERLPRTFALAICTFLFAHCIGIPLGITAATHQNKWQDTVSMIAALIGVSMPSFWVALLMVLLFSVKLGWFPAMGFGGLKYYILPGLSGCFVALATAARQTRSAMLDVIRSDYITTARAKGVPERQVIRRHALKNALIPIITQAGGTFGQLLGGVMVIETIFAIPGMGTLIVTAVNNRDYPVVQGGSIVVAITFSLIMLLVDLLYAAVDPRIKGQYASMSKSKGKKKAVQDE
jgi:peptide/nickel transport system permease protein